MAEAEGQPAELDGPQYDIDEYVFTPPEGAEVSEVGAARLEAFAEYAAANGIAPEQYSGLIGFYEKLVSKEQARLKETDKAAEAEAVAALKDTWGTGAYSENLAVARKALKDLPEPLRVALRTARTPDGRLVSRMPEFVELLYDVGSANDPADLGGAARERRQEEGALRRELAQLTKLRDENIGLYRQKAPRVLEIEKALEGIRKGTRPTPSQRKAALREEERELLALQKRDPDVFKWGT